MDESGINLTSPELHNSTFPNRNIIVHGVWNTIGENTRHRQWNNNIGEKGNPVFGIHACFLRIAKVRNRRPA
jgi:hypothetical protein